MTLKTINFAGTMAAKTKDKVRDKVETPERQRVAMTRRERAGWVAGLITICVGLFVLVATLFYFFDWKSDYNVIYGSYDKEVANPSGYFGAWIAEMIVGRSFGVSGIIIPVILIMMGVRFIRRRPVLFNHSVLSAMLVMTLGSLTLGALFGNSWSMFNSGWGGAFGIEISRLLNNKIGAAGIVLLLAVCWILTGVFINRSFIGKVNHAGEVAVEQGGRLLSFVTRRKKKPQSVEAESEPDDAAKPAEEEAPAADSETETEMVVETAAHDEPATDNPQDAAGGGAVAPAEESEFELEHIADKPADTDAENTVTAANEDEPAESDEEFELETVKVTDTAVAAAAERHEPAADEEPAPVLPSRDAIVVEDNPVVVMNESDVESDAYDPLKDLNNYKKPPVNLLEDYVSNTRVSDEEIRDNTARIEETLATFGIPIRRITATIGPTVTLYEIVQEPGVKISKIQGLEDDIAQSLKAFGIRIIAPMPGRGTIGIEVPNHDKQIVSMYSAVLSRRFQDFKADLPIVIGRTIQNENFVFDLAKMPHLLVAGATGQGKSVGLNAIITSLLYRKHPAELKFVLVDPKMVEFSLYNKLEKHFLAKMASEDEAIVTDPKKAVYTFNSLCIEMDNRLKLCQKAGARNITEYNAKFLARRLNPHNGHRFLPYIVVVVDEFADLIMMAREVEAPVMRLAQKARAIGIHLIIATQRPDVKVITGGIKANFPARIAFRVMQMNDSRTIIDQPGANQLIGRGDMLLSKDGDLTRIQCALVETKEVERVVDYISHQQGYTQAYELPDYEESGSGDMSLGSDAQSDGENGHAVRYDALFGDIARDAVANGTISTSYIQRNFEVGFNRAGRIMTQLERAGIVGPQIGAKPREIKFYDLPSLEAKLQDLGVF